MRAHGRKALSSPEQTALAAVALFVVFNVECEKHDKAICTGLPAGDGSGVMPRNTTEAGIMVQYAAQLGQTLLERADRLGVPRSVLEGAEAFVQRMPYAQVVADYSRAVLLIGGRLDA